MSTDLPASERALTAKPLTTLVCKYLCFSKKVYNLIIELHPEGTYQPDVRNTMCLALTDQVKEHLGAVIILVENQQFFGSAFALLRPLIESYFRAVWVQHIASENEVIEVAKKQKNFPAFMACRISVEKYFEAQGTSDLYVMEKEFIKALHGFTHSGVEQIQCRVDGQYQITPYKYPENSVVTLLDQAARFATMAAMIAVHAIEGKAAAMSPKVASLQQRFNGLRLTYGLEG